MPEIMGNFVDLEFPDHIKDAANNAIASYTKQLIDTLGSTQEKVMAMYNIIDEVNTDSFVKDPKKPSCSKGCAHCCYIQVSATEWEVDLIMDYMKHHNLEFTDADIETLIFQARVKNDADYVVNPNRKCIFLDENKSCEIYEVRPAACRNYFVFNDPKDCDTFDGNSDGKTLVNFNLDSITPILSLMNISKSSTLPRLLLDKLNIKY